MSKREHFIFSNRVIVYPILFVLSIWIIFWFEVRFGFNFNKYGIYPHTFKGLRGVVLSPFIHGSIEHMYHNTIPLFVLSAALFYFYRYIAWKVLIWGVILSGLITWGIGRPSYHIGASSLIYVLVSFTFFKGVFAKHYRLIALSLLVVFLYGSLIWHVLPVKEGVSWEGHLSGLITGLVFALLFRREIARPEKYTWQRKDYSVEEDPFLKHFDEQGNFVPSSEKEEAQKEDVTIVNYQYKENKD